MNKLTQTTVMALAVPLLAMSSAVATAAPDDRSGPVVMPMIAKWRTCDHTVLTWPGGDGTARVGANLNIGSNTLVADVDMAGAKPNTRYDVRIIQTPRPSSGCAPGAPGVITGSLQTDAAAIGRTTLTGPIESGATGAWITIERPAQYSQLPAEYYSTTFVAHI